MTTESSTIAPAVLSRAALGGCAMRPCGACGAR